MGKMLDTQVEGSREEFEAETKNQESVLDAFKIMGADLIIQDPGKNMYEKIRSRISHKTFKILRKKY